MIISASRRTDIPSYYTEWFFNRIREGFVCVRNPVNVHQISQISLAPEVVDGIVFWTKNPIPMMERLDVLRDYMYYVQFTLNAYGKDIEGNVPNKSDVMIPAFRELARRIGAERVIWRYDPILLTSKYTVDYHVRYFGEIAKRLSGYTRKCVISFIDLYRSTENHMKDVGMLPLGTAEMLELAERLAEIAVCSNLILETCAESIDLSQFGIEHGHCIDRVLFEQLLGCRLDLMPDPNQREACGCMTSVDIGMYNTCQNGCKYCYANHRAGSTAQHDPLSPLIAGHIRPDDVVKERVVTSCKQGQLNFL